MSQKKHSTPMTKPSAPSTIIMRGLLILLAVVAGTGRVFAATGTLFPSPWFYALDSNANPIPNAKACFYVAGTSTPATTYSDVNLTTPNANPLRGGADGKVGPIFLTPGQSYKLVLQDSTGTSGNCDGAIQRTQDNIAAVPSSSGVVDVTGTAGENLTAGQCVYLSDGSGGKTQGQWYKCDSANAYSSINNDVGIATVNIASAGTGTIRTAGQVSGLTVSTGNVYYIGSSGALTTTAPSNFVRRLGQADSSTTLVLQSVPLAVTPFVDDFRLSLSTATCLPTSDVTAATTVYLTPCTGNRITLFDTSGNVETCTTAEISIAVPASTSQMYDVWAYDSTFGSCTVTLELLAWTNDTTRATAIARSNGRWVKSGNLSRIFVGSVRTTGVSGQTEDSVLNRLLCNAYNRRPRSLLMRSAVTNWTYNTATWRQANNSNVNQVAAITCLQETTIDLEVNGAAANSTGGIGVGIGIGENSTTAVSSSSTGGYAVTGPANAYSLLSARMIKIPTLGYSYYAWLEIGTNTGTTTWAGNGPQFTGQASGLTGWIVEE